MSEITLPDDSTRPEMEPVENLTAAQRLPRRKLRAIHQHHRRNMQALHNMIAAVRNGTASADTLHSLVKSNPIFENYRLFANLCGQHCQLVTAHHSLEDSHMLPPLKGRNAMLDQVIERLRAEHGIIHALLVALADEAKALVDDPGDVQFQKTVAAFERLEKLLVSHFGYEEENVGPALGIYEIGL